MYGAARQIRYIAGPQHADGAVISTFELVHGKILEVIVPVRRAAPMRGRLRDPRHSQGMLLLTMYGEMTRPSLVLGRAR